MNIKEYIKKNIKFLPPILNISFLITGISMGLFWIKVASKYYLAITKMDNQPITYIGAMIWIVLVLQFMYFLVHEARSDLK